MQLNTFRPGKTGTKQKKRLGRGNGSKWGTTGGRGQKGAGARKSAKAGRWAFEGGQMPLQRRIPKVGFKSINKAVFQLVNLNDLERLPAGVSTVDAKVLVDHGLVKKGSEPIKLLAYGKVSRAFTLTVKAASAAAKSAIESAGGKVEIV